jgi:hypothetical protein
MFNKIYANKNVYIEIEKKIQYNPYIVLDKYLQLWVKGHSALKYFPKDIFHIKPWFFF